MSTTKDAVTSNISSACTNPIPNPNPIAPTPAPVETQAIFEPDWSLLRETEKVITSSNSAAAAVVTVLKPSSTGSSNTAASTTTLYKPNSEAPIGGFSCGVFSISKPPTSSTALMGSNAANRLRKKLQTMNNNAVIVAREKFCSSLGVIDPHMIVAKRVDAPTFYVVHRPNGNLAYITSGLWNPNEVPKNSTESNTISKASDINAQDAKKNHDLPGLEIIVEANEKELGDIYNSWLYQCLLEIACFAKRNGTKLRRLLRKRGYTTMEVMNIKLPLEFLDPKTGNACLLLGIKSQSVPEYFMAPNNKAVTVITARLLTLAEWRDSQEFAKGKKALAASFFRDNTHHVSSLILPRIPTVVDSVATVPSIATIAPDTTIPNLGDVSDYEPPIPTGVIVNAFQSGGISTILSHLTTAIRKILINNQGSEQLKTAATTVYNALGTQSQMYAWQLVSEYIRNPELYIERTKKAQKGEASASSSTAAAPAKAAASAAPIAATWDVGIANPLAPRGPSELHEDIDTLQEIGHTVVKRLIQRIEWLIHIFTRDNAELTCETLLLAIVRDSRWVNDATNFLNACEYKVDKLLSKNPERYKQFGDLQKKGVQWPHSPDLRRKIEKDGYEFRPMMIKRDRTICDTCGAEVSGWRPWYEPRSFHDYSKHTAQFRAERYPPNDPASAAASAVIKENADPINAILLTGKKIIPVTSATTPSVSEAMTSSAATTSATAAATATTTATTVTAATKLG